jgi:dihydropyrimidinase/allantoinase
LPPPFDLVIVGGQAVTGRGVFPATLAVREGRIAGLLAPEERPAAREQIEARGLHVLPGIIDTHVHTRHPGHPGREDMVSGTSAAAAGGITTILEMPISKIPVSSAAALERRVQAMQPGALVDFGLYGGAGEENVADIAGQAAAGALAFKTFLQPPPPARRDEFTGLWCTDPAGLRDVVAAVARTGLRHGFHCEHGPLLAGLQRRLEEQGRGDGLAHAESRPPVVEEAAVAHVLALGEEVGAKIHVVHLSTPRAARLVRDARARGADVSVESCPHYLVLTEDALARHRGFAKCNPPLRRREDVEALWEHLRAGDIDVLGSDHSPFLAEEKTAGADNVFLAPPGLGGLEVLLPLMLTAVAEGRLGLPALARLLSERAAELFRLPGKGRLEPGADADVTLVDLGAEWTYDHRQAHTLSKQSMQVYDGMRLRGRVVSTYVRGTRVFHEGQITAAPGHGRFVRPAVLGSAS